MNISKDPSPGTPVLPGSVGSDSALTWKHSPNPELWDQLILETSQPVQNCLIWFQGEGASGPRVESLCEVFLSFPRSRIIFPKAPRRPTEIYHGAVMPAWFDLLAPPVDQRAQANTEDEAGIVRACENVDAIIRQNIAQGIPASRHFLMGFSQGAALAIYAGCRSRQALGGVAAFSAYLPQPPHLGRAAHGLAMFLTHGFRDSLIPLARAKETLAALQHCGYSPKWETYPVDHTFSERELQDLLHWLRGHLQPANL